MSLIDIEELQADYAELRKEFLSTCQRNKELEDLNNQLRAKLKVTEMLHNKGVSESKRKVKK